MGARSVRAVATGALLADGGSRLVAPSLESAPPAAPALLHAVLLAGGSGTRFWPWSRAGLPKPFLPIAGAVPLLAETAARIRPLVPDERTIVVTHRSLLAPTRRVLAASPAVRLVGEPRALNTGPSVGVAAALLIREDPDAALVVLPSDHWIRPRDAFLRAVAAAHDAARDGWLILFGIVPDRPATGYGWIRRGPLAGRPRGIPLYEVAGFREKPDARTARAYLLGRRHRWNSGAFVFRADALLEEIARLLPRLGPPLARLARAGRRDEGRLLEAVYRVAPAVSIDRGVLERARRMRMIEPRIRWNDVGSWASFADLVPGTRDGNRSVVPRGGAFVPLDARNCFVWSTVGHVVALLGVEDLVVAHTPDATLVCPRSRAEEVRRVVAALKARRRPEWR